MRRILLASLLGLSCALWNAGETTIPPSAVAQEAKPARVTELIHSQVDGASQVLVRVEGSVTHRTERLTNPPRVALDLLGASPAMKLGTLSVTDPRIRQIRSSHYRATDPSTVRVVFDLVAPTDFQARTVEGGVLVVFGETSVAKGPGPVLGPKVEATKPPAPSKADASPAPGRTSPPMTLTPPPPPRVAQAPAPTPTPQPTPAPTSGPPVAQQAPQAPAATPAPPVRRQNKLISMDFKDADIHNLLRILSEFSGVNIVAGEDVKAKVTVRLNNVPWDQALDAVVKGAGMAYVREGNIVRVGKLENLSKEAQEQRKQDEGDAERQFRLKRLQFEFERMQRQEELKARQEEAKAREEERQQAPLQEEIIPLKYAHVGTRKVELISFFKDSVREEERKGIEDAVKPLLTSRGGVNIDVRTNSLIVRDIQDNLDRIKRFIEIVDKPVPTIQIDARIVEINRNDALTLGVKWGGVFTPDTGKNSPVVTVQGTQGSLNAPGSIGTGSTTSAVNLPPGSAVNLPGAVGTGLGLAVGIIASNFALDAALQALEGEGKAEVISRPSAVTQENQPATVASGEQIPIISVLTVGGAPQANVTFKDVTTRIQVIPRTTPDRKIQMTVGLKKEELIEFREAAGLLAPRTSKQEVVTNLVLEDGQTAVIGGLQVENKTRQERRIPLLGRIPILGWLFKSRVDEGSTRELMIFLTARILEGPPKALATPPPGGTPSGAAPAETPAPSSTSGGSESKP